MILLFKKGNPGPPWYGGLVVRNLPAMQENRFNPWSRKLSHNPEQLKPVLHNWRNCNEKPGHCNWRIAPALHNQRKASHSNKDPGRPKIT